MPFHEGQSNRSLPLLALYTATVQVNECMQLFLFKLKRFFLFVRVIRYEDLLLGNQVATNDFLDFVGLKSLPLMEQYLSKRRPKRPEDPFEAFPWMKSLNFDKIKEVQKVCSEVMKRYGYKIVADRPAMNNGQMPMHRIPPYDQDLIY